VSEYRERAEINPQTLRACPFCGGQPQAFRLMGYDYWKTEITCCGFSGIGPDDEIERRWNTRAVSAEVKARLEYLRGEIEAERISYGEIAELESLAEFIEPGDVLLLEWAGVPENKGMKDEETTSQESAEQP